MAKLCEVCGNKIDKMDILIIDGVPKVCSNCSSKYEKLKRGEIDIDEMISDYTSSEIVQALQKKMQITEETISCKETVEQDDIEKSDSAVGKIIKMLSCIVMVLAIIGSFVFMIESMALGVGLLLISCLFGMLCYGIGEICSLLSSINSKIK